MISRFITDKDFEDHKALQKRLMSLSEKAQFDEINAILDRDSVIGLKLANSILKNKDILRFCLSEE